LPVCTYFFCPIQHPLTGKGKLILPLFNGSTTILPFMESTDTDVIIQGLRQKDPVLIRELLVAYGQALYANIFQIVHSPELAEDVLQETFLKVWKGGESYDPEKGRLFTWLLNIARNAAIDATRTPHFQHQGVTEAISDSNYQPVIYYPRSDYVDLPVHLAALRKEYRVLIELAYFEGYTHEEISEHLSIPIGTVKTRIRSAMEKLRSIYIIEFL